MRFTKNSVWLSATALVALVIAGCGAASNGGGGIYGGTTSTTAPTATSAPSASALPVKTGTVTLGGAAKTVLVNAAGVTLYYHTPDTATSVWTDASTWPPLLSPNGAPTSSVALSGKLAILTDANGAQVTYNGHPLYTFAGDNNTPGQAMGDGLGGVWFAATPSLAAGSATASGLPTATPGTCTGYYCH